eukprot:scaffold6877_cov35-Phaeocystis_antarctica.AAC.3
MVRARLLRQLGCLDLRLRSRHLLDGHLLVGEQRADREGARVAGGADGRGREGRAHERRIRRQGHEQGGRAVHQCQGEQGAGHRDDWFRDREARCGIAG